jgi:hypothetical protein
VDAVVNILSWDWRMGLLAALGIVFLIGMGFPPAKAGG